MQSEEKTERENGFAGAFESKNEWLPALAENNYAFKKASPAGVAKDGYYGLPMLKRPLWKWEIALYFFFEGVSSGSYILGTFAEVFGRKEHKNLIRASRYISLAALLPCPPLLIADLGKPQKFHHMLRVWKPKSPMNFGAWTLTAFSLPVGLLALKQFTSDVSRKNESNENSNVDLASRAVGLAGVPLALIMLGYPGVLLSTTSTPVWSRTRVLGALFAASSLNNAAAALSLADSVSDKKNSASAHRLKKIENLLTAAEAAALAAYIATSKSAAKPLTSGRYAKLFWLGAVGAGLIAPTVNRLTFSEKPQNTTKASGNSPKKIKKSRAGKIIGGVLSLAGGLALKWAVTHAGRASAENPQAARDATRPNKDNPGWTQKDLSASDKIGGKSSLIEKS